MVFRFVEKIVGQYSGEQAYSHRYTALTCADMVNWLSTITPWSRDVSTAVADHDRMVMTCCIEVRTHRVPTAVP